MRSCFVASIAVSLLITATHAAAQNQPPPPPEAPPPPPGTTPPATGALPLGTAAPPPPPGATPPTTGTTTIPQGGLTPPPYPYPYPNNPQPYYGQGYPPGWVPLPPRPKMKTVWYGWQSLIGIVAGDVLTFTGGVANAGALSYIGIAGHVLSGPIVHWTHGHVGKGFAALGLNVGVPLVGGGLGAVIGGASLGGLYGAIIFGGIGYFVGPILDLSILSTEQVPDTTVTVPKGARLLMPTSLNLVPMLDQNRRGLMLVGQF